MKSRGLVLLAALVLAGCARRESHTTEPLPPVRVQAVAVQREAWPAVVETSGTVRAVQRAAIAAKVAGTIATLPVTLGQRVNAGEILLTLSADELAARVAQARAQLAQIERELGRERTLQSSGAGTADAVKALEDRVAQMQAVLREFDTLLGYATVRAPFDGVIARKYVEAGDYAAPGAPLLQFDGREAFEIEVGVPESLGAPLTVGTALEIEITGAPARLRAMVVELSSAADATARTITAKLAVPGGATVRPGQFVRVFVPGAPTSVLLVPTGTVSLFGQMERVFTVGENRRASLRLVKTGARHGDRIEIVSGLDATDRVVVAPPATLRDGQPLDLVP